MAVWVVYNMLESGVKNFDGFDYVIVGAGTAGCVLANRLSADPDVNVLLLEAGGNDNYFWIKIPVGYLYTMGNPRTDWCFETEKEPGLNGRRLNYPRGRTLGGCSAINGMIYMRGQARDYDQWRQLGNTGWGWDEVLPYFMKSEDQAAVPVDETHQSGGEWRVENQRLSWEVLDAFQEAAAQVGIPKTNDFNRGDNHGCGYFHVNQRTGMRWSTSRAFLKPARNRSNLTVLTHAEVDRIELDGRKVTGLALRLKGAPASVRVDGELILSAGSIGSPQILELSGIGNPDVLGAHGIETVHALPGVGENLQDHLAVMVSYDRKIPGSFIRTMRYDRLALAMLQAHFFGTGPATIVPAPLFAHLKSRPELAVPDIQFIIRSAPGVVHPWFPGFKTAFRDGFGIRPILLHPESRGHLRLRSADPRDTVKVFQNFFSIDSDMATLREGVRMARRATVQTPLDPYRGDEIDPGISAVSYTHLTLPTNREV